MIIQHDYSKASNLPAIFFIRAIFTPVKRGCKLKVPHDKAGGIANPKQWKFQNEAFFLISAYDCLN